MKLALLSDLHGYLPTLTDPCDLILIAGDIVPVWAYKNNIREQESWLHEEFLPWVAAQPVDVVWTWGNHDWIGQQLTETGALLHQPPNSYLLVDQTAVFQDGCDGPLVNIWATPWSRPFMDWAFMKPEAEMGDLFSQIPEATDIIITHGPPHGARDMTGDGHVTGSVALRTRIEDGLGRLKLVVTGHIHEAAGHTVITTHDDGRTVDVINASVRDLAYRVVRGPVVYDLRTGV